MSYLVELLAERTKDLFLFVGNRSIRFVGQDTREVPDDVGRACLAYNASVGRKVFYARPLSSEAPVSERPSPFVRKETLHNVVLPKKNEPLPSPQVVEDARICQGELF